MPVYYEIFSFHAFEKHSWISQFPQNGGINEQRRKLKQKIEEIELRVKKYNNDAI